MRFIVLLLFLTLSSVHLFSKSDKKLNQGFEALKQYDYFKAKAIFYEINKKQIHFASAFGLSTIYFRKDNPFTNMDSALKYLNLSYQAFLVLHQPYRYLSNTIDSTSILQLGDSISHWQFLRATKVNRITTYDRFLKENFLAPQPFRQKVILLRDEIEFYHVLQVNKSDSTYDFILKHPFSYYFKEAQVLHEREIYQETTNHQQAAEWIEFIKRHPKNIMLKDAYEKLFDFYRRKKSINGLAFYVKHYPQSPQYLEAWKLLFSLSVKAYTSEDLSKFLTEYPQFPLKNSILRELELNKLELFAFQKDDYIGFIDADGKVMIAPEFDQASSFNEGLSVVSKNDSVYFINKENVNVFNQIYSDAYAFKNGISAVKKNGKWFFINRQGQTQSKYFEEVNELSNNIYVYKTNGLYGALDAFAQPLLDAKFYKLGDFKNNMAYFIESGLYGFISTKGVQYKAEFDWISDFDEQQLAIYKLNNKFGIINAQGQKITDNQFDQISKLNDEYYLVVNNNQYGFISRKSCFMTPLNYDYNKEKPLTYYFFDRYFKLIKKSEEAIMDANGHLLVNYGLFKEVNFPINGLMLAKRKTKYGFIDKKMNVVIPFKYQSAQNFKGGQSIVVFKEKYQIITETGQLITESEKPITFYNEQYYIVGDEVKNLMNRQGEVVLSDITTIQPLNNKLLIVTFANGELKLLKD